MEHDAYQKATAYNYSAAWQRGKAKVKEEGAWAGDKMSEGWHKAKAKAKEGGAWAGDKMSEGWSSGSQYVANLRNRTMVGDANAEGKTEAATAAAAAGAAS